MTIWVCVGELPTRKRNKTNYLVAQQITDRIGNRPPTQKSMAAAGLGRVLPSTLAPSPPKNSDGNSNLLALNELLDQARVIVGNRDLNAATIIYLLQRVMQLLRDMIQLSGQEKQELALKVLLHILQESILPASLKDSYSYFINFFFPPLIHLFVTISQSYATIQQVEGKISKFFSCCLGDQVVAADKTKAAQADMSGDSPEVLLLLEKLKLAIHNSSDIKMKNLSPGVLINALATGLKFLSGVHTLTRDQKINLLLRAMQEWINSLKFLSGDTKKEAIEFLTLFGQPLLLKCLEIVEEAIAFTLSKLQKLKCKGCCA